MKVLQINATFANGSTGTIVQDLQQCCEENGIECHVAYATSRLPQKEIRNGYKIGNVVSNKLHAFLARINGKQAYFSYLPTLMLLRHIAKIQPDVIHLHNLHSNYINLNMLLRYIAKKSIATVITLHDCWYFTGGCFHYTNAQCNKWQMECGNCPKKMQDTPAYFFDRSNDILKDRYKYLNAIKNLTVVGVSKWITGEGRKSVFRNTNSITIYNGVDMNIFKPSFSDFRKQHGIDDKFVILGPASKWLDPINNGLLNAVTQTMDPDMVLVLYGCFGVLPKLPDNVITIGFTSSKKELAQLYSMADIFVNCTHEDSLSFINIESQSCGTQVITYSNTGAFETVDGISSFRVDTGDVKGLLEMIRKIKAKEVRHETYNLLSWVSANFERNKNYLDYINLYKQQHNQ